jgi:membrane peptidoglycan carboxypeptidase
VPRTVWTSLASSKTSAIGRVFLFSVIGGVLAAAMVVPVVAATGIGLRNAADKFTTLKLTGTTDLPQRSEILDRDGHLITYVYGVDLGNGRKYTGLNRQPVSFSQIAPVMQDAIVGIEDDRYWEHGAIDVKGTIRALVNDMRHQPVQGGSTIAQQYVKNVLILSAPNPQTVTAATADTLNGAGISRKLNELRMAVDVEHQMTKQDILAGYLNDAYFGHGAYGVEAAAETYFGTTASKLNLTQAALLAGIVENPSQYDPIVNPKTSLTRRNTVLARMYLTNNGLTKAQAAAAESKPLGLNPGVAQNGCTASSVGNAGYFCDYVMHVLTQDSTLGSTPAARAELLATGGLRIYTTLSPTDQRAATQAVNYVVPERSNVYNPGHNADTEVVVQPGTGQVMAIAQDKPYGTSSRYDTEVDYGVNTPFGGEEGVQTGSSSKLFTLVTALEAGIPFGYTDTVKNAMTVSGYTNCAGASAGVDQQSQQPGAWSLVNSSSGDQGTYSLYTGTTDSINTFFARLEQKVGLCNVVRTAADMGMTWANGVSLLKGYRLPNAPRNCRPSEPNCWQPSADNYPGFTLGELNVSPMSMAAAYATVAADGKYCAPVAIARIVTGSGTALPVPSAGCHQAIPKSVAEATNYILQGVLTSGTAAPPAGPGGLNRPAAGKTGTSDSGQNNGTPYAAFAGYTPTLVSYTSVFNPLKPLTATMTGMSACYRLEDGTQSCPSQMFGANAPASTWHMTFDHAALGPAVNFTPLPQDSPLWSKGDGTVVKQQKPCPKRNPNCNNGNGTGLTGGIGGVNTGLPITGGPITGVTTGATTAAIIGEDPATRWLLV